MLHKMFFWLTIFLVHAGKSTAAKCALSLYGQQSVSHIMKTHATSDSLCAERMAQSTLPFVLDDPKSPDDIGEMLITMVDFRGSYEKACENLGQSQYSHATLA